MNIGRLVASDYQNTVRHRVSSEHAGKGLPIELFIGACIAADFLIVAAVTFCVHPFPAEDSRFPVLDFASALIVGGIYNLTCQRGQLYDIRTLRAGIRSCGRIVLRLGILCAILLTAMTIAGTAERAEHTRMLVCFVVGVFGLSFSRVVIGQAIRSTIRRGNYIHSVAIIGDHASADAIIRKIGGKRSGIHISGIYPAGALMSETVATDSSLRALFGREDIDSVIITAPSVTAGGIGSMMQLLRRHPVNIYVTPDSFFLPKISSAWLRQTGFPELDLIPLVHCPRNRAELLIKHATDRLVALLLILFTAPLLLLCALGVALSDRDGPIFFRQKRIGYRGREFFILKFRTMYATPRPNTQLTVRNDPRVFAFGRLLRATSLDELPQLLNVLKGDMSLVGPRPHMPEATAAGVLYFDAVSEYTARHRVKPGITGWAQVNGFRGPTETIDQIERRVAHDIYYIENWSLVMDFMILFKTAFVMFGKNVF